jgi:hypothetical protein
MLHCWQARCTARLTVSSSTFYKPTFLPYPPPMPSIHSPVFTAQADMEGFPEVSLVLQAARTMSDMAVHPCVVAADTASQAAAFQFRLRFLPPADAFDLCHYQVTPRLCSSCSCQVPSDFICPIRGFYQLKVHYAIPPPPSVLFLFLIRCVLPILLSYYHFLCSYQLVGGDSAKMLLQLKLHDSYPNLFEYCDVTLPFRGRGRVREIEGSPSCGTAAGVFPRVCVRCRRWKGGGGGGLIKFMSRVYAVSCVV